MENKQILFSVVTPAFNSAKTIRDTFDSMLNQTYQNYQYIVIDGGSTDGTLDIIKEYEPKFAGKMTWLSEKDGGIYYALNKGIDLAVGDLVSPLNSDDWYEKTTLEKVAATHKLQPEAFIYGIVRYFQDEKVSSIGTGSHEFLPGSLIPYPTWFIPMCLVKKFGKFSTTYRVGSDVELVLRYFKNKVEFVRIDEILTNFRLGGESTKHMYLSRMEVIQAQYALGFISKNKMRYNVLLLKFEILKNAIKLYLRGVIAKVIRYD
ncbi:MAG: glycosyltransferase family 2 protein [bacterium]